MPMPDLPTAPPKQLALVVFSTVALLAVAVGAPAGLTWLFTHDGSWVAVAGVLSFVVSWLGMFVVGTVIDMRRARKVMAKPLAGPLPR
jgi:hypothetical protein